MISQNFDAYDNNEVIIQTQTHLVFPRLNKQACSPRKISLNLGRWQGPPNLIKVKLYETVTSFKVSLFIRS